MSKFDYESSIESFNTIWGKVILPLINQYKRDCFDVVVKDNAQEIIWNNYSDFRSHCRNTYMASPDGLLDRHKVCACLIYGISKSSVLSENVPRESHGKRFDTINEDLALTTGLTLFRAFIESSIRNNTKLNQNEKKNLLRKFENGFIFPESYHGDYRENFLAELYFTKKENNYNILSLSHSLFLLETYNRTL